MEFIENMKGAFERKGDRLNKDDAQSAVELIFVVAILAGFGAIAVKMLDGKTQELAETGAKNDIAADIAAETKQEPVQQPVIYQEANVSDMLSTLETSNVYVEDGASISNLSKVQEAYSGSPVAIVVLNSENSNDLKKTSYNVQSRTDFDTVIVVKDQFSAVSATYEEAKIHETVEALPNMGASLLSGSDAIIAYSSEASLVETVVVEPPVPADRNVNAALGVTGGFLAMAVVGTVIAVTVSKLRSKARRRKPTKNTIKDMDKNFADNFEELLEILLIHDKMGSKTADQIQDVMTNMAELWKRAKKRSSPDQKIILEVKYSDIFSKLVKLLGENYYIDIYNNKNLWDRPAQRMREVELKLDSVNGQIMTNIRQVNASQDLDFRVALESLMDSSSDGYNTVFEDIDAETAETSSGSGNVITARDISWNTGSKRNQKITGNGNVQIQGDSNIVRVPPRSRRF